MCKGSFPYCLLYGPCALYNMCILCAKLFLCYLHSLLKKHLSMVSSFCFCVVFVAAFINMFCTFMTYSTSYCCHYKLMDAWTNVCMYYRYVSPSPQCDMIFGFWKEETASRHGK
jgi:hypothetical protein